MTIFFFLLSASRAFVQPSALHASMPDTCESGGVTAAATTSAASATPKRSLEQPQPIILQSSPLFAVSSPLLSPLRCGPRIGRIGRIVPHQRGSHCPSPPFRRHLPPLAEPAVVRQRSVKLRQAAFIWLLQPGSRPVGTSSARGRGALCPVTRSLRLHAEALLRGVAHQPPRTATQDRSLPPPGSTLPQVAEPHLQLPREATRMEGLHLPHAHVGDIFFILFFLTRFHSSQFWANFAALHCFAKHTKTTFFCFFSFSLQSIKSVEYYHYYYYYNRLNNTYSANQSTCTPLHLYRFSPKHEQNQNLPFRFWEVHIHSLTQKMTLTVRSGTTFFLLHCTMTRITIV